MLLYSAGDGNLIRHACGMTDEVVFYSYFFASSIARR